MIFQFLDLATQLFPNDAKEWSPPNQSGEKNLINHKIRLLSIQRSGKNRWFQVMHRCRIRVEVTGIFAVVIFT
jgi:hypothetical protein